MSNTTTARTQDTPYDASHKRRVAVTSTQPAGLADVYQDEVNIAIWQRQLPDDVLGVVGRVLKGRPVTASMTVTPQNVAAGVEEALGSDDTQALSDDVASLVQMFCELFALKRVGLRLTTLDRAMCPRFHTDLVPCRMITTYSGVATQWLPHAAVDRAFLGSGSDGRPDAQTGLYLSDSEIQQVETGDVALLKGDGWVGNEGAGLVHRSPTVPCGEQRLLLTVDFSS